MNKCYEPLSLEESKSVVGGDKFMKDLGNLIGSISGYIGNFFESYGEIAQNSHVYG